jgi:hypothetical protein
MVATRGQKGMNCEELRVPSLTVLPLIFIHDSRFTIYDSRFTVFGSPRYLVGKGMRGRRGAGAGSSSSTSLSRTSL